MAAGRPTKYHPKYCKVAVELMSEGASITEVAATIGISKQTLHNWKAKWPEFMDAINSGIELSEAWWERQGRTALRDKEFSYTGWYMNMKNRFGWVDRQQTALSGPDGGPIEIKGIDIGFVATDKG